MRKIAPGWLWLDNYDYSDRGRIWVIWNPVYTHIILESMSAQFIHTTVQIKASNLTFAFTIVYGLHTQSDKRGLWNDLRSIHIQQQEQWLDMGDYNAIRAVEDRVNGGTPTKSELRDLNEFLEDTKMTTLRASGREYTWTNGHTYNTIDWGLVNARWMMAMALHELFIMDPRCFDHSPMSLYLAQDEDTSLRPFKFLNHVAGHEKFPKTIEEMWSKMRGRCRMADIWRNLKHVKKAMKHLNATEFGGVEKRINSC
ncbi:hypothetical protein KY290_012922 [Solanum tuberosum]|uniref:Non-LTR retroelement reverse transcriptase n=1 Tax=Solanum tuberosum TaxID=4113 RepID=A0ABQ7VKA9_SOLTU|nr:hypothetical protein KY285_012692 [Solanum tuberosum]KAH0768941.1 hypothetical protein KY290_012922 [Solanum tuberosum]